jgi:hypothetical protein
MSGEKDESDRGSGAVRRVRFSLRRKSPMRRQGGFVCRDHFRITLLPRDSAVRRASGSAPPLSEMACFASTGPDSRCPESHLQRKAILSDPAIVYVYDEVTPIPGLTGVSLKWRDRTPTGTLRACCFYGCLTGEAAGNSQISFEARRRQRFLRVEFVRRWASPVSGHRAYNPSRTHLPWRSRIHP